MPTDVTVPEQLPEAVRRACGYAAIFLNIGDRWRDFLPVDADVIEDRVYLQGVQLWREGDAWHIGDGKGGHWAFRSAPAEES